VDHLKEVVKNRVLGNPVRLGIMLFLLPRGKVPFGDFIPVLNITPGNLDSHLRTLEREGYVTTKKMLLDRPRTVVKITDFGSVETRMYIRNLHKALDEV